MTSYGLARRELATWVSPHTEADVLEVGAVLARADLFARVTPLNPDTAAK